MPQSFEDFLREKLQLQNWPILMCDVKLTGEDWIKYANDWHSQEMAKAVPSVEEIAKIIGDIHYREFYKGTKAGKFHKMCANAIRSLCEGKEKI